MYNNPRSDLYTSRLVADYIVRHPERYKPVQTQRRRIPRFTRRWNTPFSGTVIACVRH